MHPILKEIVDKCSAIEAIEKRNITNTSCDLVFSLADKENLNKLFCDLFGPPIKPTGKQPSLYHKLLTKKYGGIRKHQKLFVKRYEEDNATILAMFWPWEKALCLTVRIVALDGDEIKDAGLGWPSALTAWVRGAVRQTLRSV